MLAAAVYISVSPVNAQVGVNTPSAVAQPAGQAEYECREDRPDCREKLAAFTRALDVYRRAKDGYLVELERAFAAFAETRGNLLALERAIAGLRDVKNLQNEYARSEIKNENNKIFNYVSKMDAAAVARSAYSQALANAVNGPADKSVEAIRAAQGTLLSALEDTVNAALLLTEENRSIAALLSVLQQLQANIQRLIPAVDGQVKNLTPYADDVLHGQIAIKRSLLDNAKRDLAMATVAAEQAGVVFKKPAPEKDENAGPRPSAGVIIRIESATYGGYGSMRTSPDICDVSEQFRMICQHHVVPRKVCFKDKKPSTDCNSVTDTHNVSEFVAVQMAACATIVQPSLCDIPTVREQYPRRVTVRYKCSDAPNEVKTATARDNEQILLTCVK
jgi:hypothetical protein